ncbi:hypothetical protein D3C76_921650 [compost metagenome]
MRPTGCANRIWPSGRVSPRGCASSRAGSWRWKPCSAPICMACCWTISPGWRSPAWRRASCACWSWDAASPELRAACWTRCRRRSTCRPGWARCVRWKAWSTRWPGAPRWVRAKAWSAVTATGSASISCACVAAIPPTVACWPVARSWSVCSRTARRWRCVSARSTNNWPASATSSARPRSAASSCAGASRRKAASRAS